MDSRYQRRRSLPTSLTVALWWIVGVAIQLAFVAALFAFVALAHYVLFT